MTELLYPACRGLSVVPGLLGFSLWRGYEAKYIWPCVQGKVFLFHPPTLQRLGWWSSQPIHVWFVRQVIKWTMSGSVVNPIATLQFGYTVDNKTWYFGVRCNQLCSSRV